MYLPATFALLVSSAALSAADEAPKDLAPNRALARAHAHNDYHHARPLLDALEHGFSGVEADVFLVDGKLLIGHSRLELRPERTLEALYLEPLRARVRERGGFVHRRGLDLLLLIDFKNDGEATWKALRVALEPYREMLTEFHADRIESRAVTVVISGDRPWSAIEADVPRLAAVDGRLDDLESKRPASLMPLVSDRWTSHFEWGGDGPIPDAERKKLHDIVARAHRAGWRLRFWATPEKPALWKELLAADVDLINTDDLDGLRRFLLEHDPDPAGKAAPLDGTKRGEGSASEADPGRPMPEASGK